ncbi:glutamate racemase [Candidatus Peregrinibacteria bacterium]|nr:glutamate racemase [Candidatus Peregrinibacteria bacterium]
MIGIFDSGYGGMTVLKPIMDLLPEYDYLYLGDNARAPYGNHSPENIQRFSEQAINFLFDKGIILIIFACNTASSTALRYIQKKYLNGNLEKNKKILGVLIPAVEKAVNTTKINRIGVVGTKATIASRVYEKEITKINKNIKVVGSACPLLVPFIEEGWHNKPEAKSILKKYLKPLKTNNIDTLILGCTHYPLMKNDFQKIMGNKVKIISSGEATAESLKDYLKRHPEIEKKITKNKKRQFITTDNPQRFKRFVEKHFGIKISTPEKITLN